MLKAGVNPLFPSLSDILHFLQLLSNSCTLQTVKNYLSGTKTFITNYGGDPTPLASPHIQAMLRGVARLSTHVPAQAPNLEPNEVKAMCDVMWSLGPDARIARAAVLFAYVTFLRQSNYLQTGSISTHMIRRADIRPAPYGLAVHVRSTKTIAPSGWIIIPVHRSPDSPYCPVAAVMAAKLAVPAPLTAPLFLTGSGRPLTATALTTLMRLALTVLGHPAASTVTPHSLRRAGARGAAGHGEGVANVMTHGTWSGRAVFTYVPKHLFTSVPKTMSQLLGP